MRVNIELDYDLAVKVDLGNRKNNIRVFPTCLCS